MTAHALNAAFQPSILSNHRNLAKLKADCSVAIAAGGFMWRDHAGVPNTE
jgi:hypothetical protein